MPWLYGINTVFEVLNTSLDNKHWRTFDKCLICSENLYEEVIEKYSNINKRIELVSPFTLKKILGDVKHQSIAIKVEKLYNEVNIKELCNTSKRILILDRLQSPENIGNITRTAACFHFDIIVITRNSCGINLSACKVSCGGIEHIKICNRSSLLSTIPILKQSNFQVIGMEAEHDEIFTCSFDHNEKIAIIIGSEGEGIQQNAKKMCDKLLSIKTNNNFSILNAANAAAIVTWYFK